MSACGNHGVVIPRDRELLSRLYWDDGLSFPKIAALYGVEHSSIRKVFKQLGIPSRGLGCYAKTVCRGCGGRFKLPNHPKAKQSGGYCSGCLRIHRAAIARAYHKEKVNRDSAKTLYRRWYESGAIYPKGPKAVNIKARALLRSEERERRKLAKTIKTLEQVLWQQK